MTKQEEARQQEARQLANCPLTPAGEEAEYAHHYVQDENGWTYTCARCLQQVAVTSDSDDGKFRILRKGLDYISPVTPAEEPH